MSEAHRLYTSEFSKSSEPEDLEPQESESLIDEFVSCSAFFAFRARIFESKDSLEGALKLIPSDSDDSECKEEESAPESLIIYYFG